jgi:hypothetical protein
VDPATTRTTSGEPSHPDAILTPTRDKNPDDHEPRKARERSGLGRGLQIMTTAATAAYAALRG